MITFGDFDELRSLTAANGDVLTVTMEQLRDAYGVERLGVHVKNGIIRELDGRGLKAFPADLRNYQHEEVRIYRSGSPIADVIDAVLNPSEAHDTELREFVGNGAAGLIQRIRELVCD